ncbi:ArsR/SmtB family transcription factor [Cryptosporangium aurantiacum]|uniref:DNA-binding transcriptional regulator, ArsR family n=1 Tax=Cryptosporangium aurantiacum TaxID=134849 RepID=A0A1M7QDD8_9ACTN|nr:winged helix-turn-helix domain-containing protein [Cryptosporangium aurantiacum]SHN28662.1 DNA-binding transcriptional regulator, ArsR family [Cryptosporangium aurantiacum]
MTDVLSAIGDPIRFEVLRQLLADDGPAQAALAERLGVTPSRLGNHLAALRAAGLVDPVRAGRSTRYTLRNPDAVRALVGAVDTLAGQSPGSVDRAAVDAAAGNAAAAKAAVGNAAAVGAAVGDAAAVNAAAAAVRIAARAAAGAGAGAGGRLSPFAQARTCYDHLAGEAGVRVLDRLMADGALIPGPEPESVLQPGATLPAALERLGVDYPQVGRRKLAVGCLDATAGRPHLGGALGGEILRSFLRRGLLLPGPVPRSLIEHAALEPLLG